MMVDYGARDLATRWELSVREVFLAVAEEEEIDFVSCGEGSRGSAMVWRGSQQKS